MMDSELIIGQWKNTYRGVPMVDAPPNPAGSSEVTIVALGETLNTNPAVCSEDVHCTTTVRCSQLSTDCLGA